MNKAPYMHIYHSRDVRLSADCMGSHMFSPATMRYFNSRVLDTASYVTTAVESETGATGYMVTSERYDETEPRLYTVRAYTIRPDSIWFDTVGEFQQYATARAAKNAAQELAIAARAQIVEVSA